MSKHLRYLALAILFSPSFVFAQWEMGYGTLSSNDLSARAKGDTISWMGQDCYISSRTDCTSGICAEVFHIVDQNGCPMVQSNFTVADPNLKGVYLRSIKSAGPDQFVYTGYKASTNTGCSNDLDLVIGYFNRVFPLTSWSHSYGEEDIFEVGHDIIIDSDDNIVVTGYAVKAPCAYPNLNSYEGSYLLMAKYTKAGLATTDGGVRLFRSNQQVNQGNYLRYFAYTGNTLIEQEDPDTGDMEYVVAGKVRANSAGLPTTSPDHNVATIMRIHRDITRINLIKRKRFPLNVKSEAFDLLKMANGRLLIVGEVSGLSGSLGGKDAFTIDVQADCKGGSSTMNYNIFGGSGDESAQSVVSDGGNIYYFSGQSNTFISGTNPDIFLFQGFFSNGNLSIMPRPFPLSGTVSLFGGNVAENNLNMVYDTRNVSDLHLFNERGPILNYNYPDYHINVPTFNRSSGCEDGGNFSLYDEGALLPTNGTQDTVNFAVYNNGSLVSGMLSVSCDNICEGCSSSHKKSPTAEQTIAGISETAEIAVYPNPVENQLTIRTAEQLEWISITDGTGRLIVETQAKGLSEKQIDLSKLKAGVYFVKVKTVESLKTVKIVKE